MYYLSLIVSMLLASVFGWWYATVTDFSLLNFLVVFLVGGAIGVLVGLIGTILEENFD